MQATFDPVYVTRFVWRWRWLVAAATVLGIAGGTLVAATTPKTWLAAATVLLDPRDLKVVQNEVAPNALPSDATLALIESQTAVATSDRVLAEVIAKAGLANDPEFDGSLRTGLAGLLPFDPAPLDEAERDAHRNETLVKAITVAREPKSFIIHLAVRSFDPQKSARIANVLAETFIAEIGSIQSDTARRATRALSSRLSELRRSVVEAENHVEDYKSRNSLIGVAGRLVDDAYITRVNDQLARARAEIAALRVRAQSLAQASVEDVVSGGLPEEAAAEALTRLRQNHAELAQQAASLGATLGPRHPQRIAVDSALRVARDSIRRELARIVAAGQTDLARAMETERDLSGQIDALKTKQVQTSEAFVKLRELEREVDASRAVYEAFLLRARETSEQESLNTANVRVISDAVAPIRSAGPSRKLIVAAGGIMGFAFGAGVLAAFAMLRLAVGFLRLDRRGSKRAVWSAAERAASAPTVAPSANDPKPDIQPNREIEAAGALSAAVSPRDRLSMSAPDRLALREQVRALGLQSSHPPRPDAERIEAKLKAVREALVGMRRRRLRSESA